MRNLSWCGLSLPPGGLCKMQLNPPIIRAASTKPLFDMLRFHYSTGRMSGPLRGVFWFLLAGACHAQLSSSAYRALGQPDLQQNGVNIVNSIGLNSPIGVALDARGGQVHVYISDTQNARVLAWADLNAYRTGDPPTLVLGQPSSQYSTSLGIGSMGFTKPLGLAVDPTTGNLYVADFGDNRVLRFPSPFANPSRIEPDAVYGQASSTGTAAGLSSTTMNGPRAVACDAAGDLWVADSGNNRVLRFAAATLNSSAPVAADTVIGQTDFTSGSANQGSLSVSASGLSTPAGLAFDAQGNLYVADFSNMRVVRFPTPLGPSSQNPVANGVWGPSNLTTRGVAQPVSGVSMSGPLGISVDSDGNLYVANPTDNRVLVFPTTTAAGATSSNVYGQASFTQNAPNAGVAPLASGSSLATPADVKIDLSGNAVVVDSGNNRVLEFPSGSKTAARVWGQTDFTSNGTNRIKPGSLNAPFKMAIDYSAPPFALYVSDAANNRVLIWKDSVHFQTGDPADLVIGQPSLLTSAPNVDSPRQTPSATSLSSPAGLAINPADGTLYVADYQNNRVLRYPRPVAQSGRITPDAVLGQTDFVSSTSAAVNASSLKNPAGLAIGPNGDLFVADSGNNRVLEFPAGAGSSAMAIRVYGQPNMFSAIKPSQVTAQTLSAPQGITVDPATNLYVADTVTNRVVLFPNTSTAPAAGAVAAFVIGQPSFSTTSGTIFKTPTDVAVDSSGNIYVADANNNRVLTYPSLVFLPAVGAAASGVIGQPSLTGVTANWDSPGNGLASADGFYGPEGLYVDRQDTLYVSDVGNSRVLQFLKPSVVVNAAAFQASAPVAQGALAVMFGAGLASNTVTSSSSPWQPTLENRQITIDDQTLSPIYYMSSTQANFQIPSNAALGTQRVALRTGDTGELIAGGSLLISAASPGLFTTNQSGTGQAAAINQDGTINSPSNAAPVGSTVTLYGTGQGPVSPAIQDGTAAGTFPFSYTIAVPTSNPTTCFTSQPSMCVAIASGFGNVQYSGLAPGYVGLWQINVTIPQGTSAGSAVPIRVVINSTASNLVTIAVK